MHGISPVCNVAAANISAVSCCTVDAGGLVPDEVISTICEKAVIPHSSYILDGYPRTAGQALDCISWKNLPVTAAVFVDVPSWVVQRKISGR